MGAVLRIGTRTADGSYEGVLRNGSRVVAACGHRHHNRDISTQTNGQSARGCIAALVRSARYPEQAADIAGTMRRGAEAYLRTWQASAGQAARMREAARQGADAFLARLPEIAAIIGNEPVYGYTNHVDVPPVPPEGVTCRHCRTPLTPDNYVPGKGWVNWKDQHRDWACPAPGVMEHQPAEEN